MPLADVAERSHMTNSLIVFRPKGMALPMQARADRDFGRYEVRARVLAGEVPAGAQKTTLRIVSLIIRTIRRSFIDFGQSRQT